MKAYANNDRNAIPYGNRSSLSKAGKQGTMARVSSAAGFGPHVSQLSLE